MISKQTVLNLKMQRQHFYPKANPAEYNGLFRLMSPVTTLYWTRPGDPPTLVHRADFDDIYYNDGRRSRREIIKGRFQKGGIGYISADEMELFAGLYRIDLGKLSKKEYEILDLLEHEGSLNIHELKEVTKMFVKDITPILHRLQEGFRVYEDQRDREWDRSWYAFENEFPEVDIKRYTRIEALKIVLMRFAEAHVFFDLDMARSFYQLPKSDIELAIKGLVEEKALDSLTFEGKNGFMRTKDVLYLKENEVPKAPPSVYLIHRNDFLVKSHEPILKKQYHHPDYGLLFYVLIDGEFIGALYGRFTFGPIEVRSIQINLSKAEFESRKSEILDAIHVECDPEVCPLPEITLIEN